jgi:hypothetical protein
MYVIVCDDGKSHIVNAPVVFFQSSDLGCDHSDPKLLVSLISCTEVQ